MMPFLFGAGLGVAQVLFGLAALCVGMALSFATTIGLGAALGTLVPILLRHPAVLKTARGEILVLGVLLMVAGVIVCSWAGRRREREQRSEAAEVGERSYMIGIVMAAAAGLLAPMLNHSLALETSTSSKPLPPHHAARCSLCRMASRPCRRGGSEPRVRLPAHVPQ
jgi:L-rhamnose-H+ transport protein